MSPHFCQGGVPTLCAAKLPDDLQLWQGVAGWPIWQPLCASEIAWQYRWPRPHTVWLEPPHTVAYAHLRKK